MQTNRLSMGLALILALLFTCWMVPLHAAENPRVGVLQEEGFPSIKISSLESQSVIAAYERAGFDAAGLDIAAFQESWRDYDVLVLPYGNAFPKQIAPSLEQAANQGTVIVLTGIPLTHPIVGEQGTWESQGHTDAYAEQLGAGSFLSGGSRQIAPEYTGHQIGLGSFPFGDLGILESLQGLGATPLQAEVRPLLASPEGLPYAAIIGYPDGRAFIWAGTTDFSAGPRITNYVIGEIMVRATAKVLLERERIAPQHAQTIFSAPPNEDILAEATRKYEASFLEQRPQRLYPAADDQPEVLLFLDMSQNEDPGDRLLAASIQAIHNSSPAQTHLYISRNDSEAKWAEWMVQRGYVREVKRIATLQEALGLIEQREAVLAGNAPYHAVNFATMIAGMEGLLVALDASVLEKYNLNARVDLRGQYETNAEGYEDIWNRYQDRFSQHVLAIYHPQRVHALRDYLIANRVFTFWIGGPAEAGFPGADASAELNVIQPILAEDFPVNIPVLGYPWAGHGYGLGEGRGVTFLSSAGKFLVPSDYIGNMTVFTSMPNEGIDPVRVDEQAVSYHRDKRYAALVMSDGDNLCTWVDFFPSYWNESKDNPAPVGWTIGPSVIDMLPPIFEYVGDHLPKGDSIGSGVSGIGYIYISDFGAFYEESDREKAIQQFMEMTNDYCQRTGIEWQWIMGYGDYGSEKLSYYTRHAPDLDPLMGGYGKVAQNPDQAVEKRDGTLIFHSVTSAVGLDAMKSEIESLYSDDAPQFAHIFLLNWEYEPQELAQLTAYLEELGINVVTPEQLADLYRQSSQ